jgi:hypothetical protein
MKLLTKTGWILLLCILSFSSSFAYSQDSTVINESGSWIDNNRFNTGPPKSITLIILYLNSKCLESAKSPCR